MSPVTKARPTSRSARRVDPAGQATITPGLFLLVLAPLRGNDDGPGREPDVRRADPAGPGHAETEQ
jgi:hypothetical protein